ncbi:hypothetical protein JRO89_XS04G0244300 [Xanthoceras sorbifolium]|uniref:Uncharacterized protein n=1 Tax=Xanthoceras sorbifolium TaxID=99658 RepID=A0ABQ8I6V5_9ROSI|nr:hypothetical protein JRO89_XS04G0244300 [Xanthoceras sorbifolium]
MIPKPVRALAATSAIIFGGFVTLNITSTITLAALRAATEAKLKKFALPCGVCKGKGFYICKLCKGNATIQWSPLYDPVFINPCLCPTCDGNRVYANRIRNAASFPLHFTYRFPSHDEQKWNLMKEIGAALSKLSGEGLSLTCKRQNTGISCFYICFDNF